MANRSESTVTGWYGWIVFGAYLIMLNGVLQMIAGFTGVFSPDYFIVSADKLLLLSYEGWGWVNVVTGLFLLSTGISLLSGKTWARISAVFIVILGALTHLAFMNAYPIWGVILLIIDAFILYALIKHGSEAKQQ